MQLCIGSKVPDPCRLAVCRGVLLLCQPTALKRCSEGLQPRCCSMPPGSPGTGPDSTRRKPTAPGFRRFRPGLNPPGKGQYGVLTRCQKYLGQVPFLGCRGQHGGSGRHHTLPSATQTPLPSWQGLESSAVQLLQGLATACFRSLPKSVRAHLCHWKLI